MSVSALLFSFDGRIPRKTFWLAFVPLFLCNYALLYLASSGHEETLTVLLLFDMYQHVLLAFVPLFLYNYVFLYRAGAGGGGIILFLLLGLCVFWMLLAVQVKRWHDRGQSGWMALLVLVPPMIALLFTVFPGWLPVPLSFEFALLLSVTIPTMELIPGVCALVALGCFRGTAGRNAYGADPLV
jgi:uncharacterized membrane protein YhaH (DUF805 family)